MGGWQSLFVAYSNCAASWGYIGYPYPNFAHALVQFAALPWFFFFAQPQVLNANKH